MGTRMKRPGPVSRFAAPLKLFAQRFTFLGLIAAAVGMMMLGKAETAVVERVRMIVVDAFVPHPRRDRPAGRHRQPGVDRVNEIVHVHAENARLREENARLLQWQRSPASSRPRTSPARPAAASRRSWRSASSRRGSSADAGGSFVRTVVVTAGCARRRRQGQAAVDRRRAGRPGHRGRRVLGARAADHRPQQPRARGGRKLARPARVLAGDNSARPRLLYLPATAKPAGRRPRRHVGHGGVFPPGLPVGVVVPAATTACASSPSSISTGSSICGSSNTGSAAALPVPATAAGRRGGVSDEAIGAAALRPVDPAVGRRSSSPLLLTVHERRAGARCRPHRRSAPDIVLIAVFYWMVHRPDLMRLWTAFVLGLLQRPAERHAARRHAAVLCPGLRRRPVAARSSAARPSACCGAASR